MGNARNIIRGLLAAVVLAAGLVAAPVATPAAAAEQSCAGAIQGKVAWNQAGDKKWEPGNLPWLCESTTLVDSTIECFSNEIRRQDDWERAVRTCTEGRHEVEVVYVIPKDKQARPDIEKALAAIMAVTQRHFFQQLGVTFKLKTPFLQVVHVDETSEALKKDNATFERCGKLANNRFKADFLYRENVVMCFFEGDNPAGLGGGNIVALPTWIWGPGYEAFRKDPSADLSKVLVLGAISHEMGHTFGLDHTQEARPCFKKNGVDLGTLPNLIMQNKEDPLHVSVYDVPFLAQEKRLLRDPHYLPDCRPLLSGRPHASWHLRNPLPRDNPAIARPAAPAGATVTGREVKTVRHAAGAFRMIAPRQWIEEDSKGATKFNFGEESRDVSSVVLFDPGRNYHVRLDLRQQQVLLAVGTSQFSPLYDITESSSAHGGNSTRPAL